MSPATRVLLFGGAGMLGTDLRRTAPADVGIVSPDIGEVDITDATQVARVMREVRPDVIINAAAYTAVDQAERDASVADAINGEGPRVLGEAAATSGARVVHYSTDYVFPGSATVPYREDDDTDPVNAYGRSKLLGEHALLTSGAETVILRTQWLFGHAGKSFPRTMWERATSGLPTRVVDDQVGRPTYTVDLARATWRILGGPVPTILHAANGGPSATWHEFASHVFARAGRPDLLSPCDSAAYPTPARRPRFSVLATERLEALLGAPLPDWRDALDRFLDELAAG